MSGSVERGLAVAFLVVVGACSTTSKTSAPVTDGGCNAGDTRECLGPGQCQGAQICDGDGGFGACECSVGGSGGGSGASSGGSAGQGGAGAGGVGAGGGMGGAGAQGGAGGTGAASGSGGSGGSSGAGGSGGVLLDAGADASTGGSAGAGSGGSGGLLLDAGMDACVPVVTPLFVDHFERADGALGSAEMPASPWVGFLGTPEISSGGFASGNHDDARASVDLSSSLGYNEVRLRFQFTLNEPGNWVIVGYDTDGAVSTKGINLRIFGHNNSVAIQETDLDLQVDSVAFQVGTAYFAEMVVSGSQATATIATADYATLGGTVLTTVGPATLEQNETGTHVSVVASSSGTPALTPLIEEVRIDRVRCP